MRILLVENEICLADSLVDALEADAYAVDRAVDGSTADDLEFVNSYDLVILDWNIPPPTGIELLRHWRDEGDGTPVLMLSEHPSIETVVSGLDTGADDFLAKPFSIQEFLARVRSLLRRRATPLQLPLSAAGIEMNRASHRVTVNGEEIELTRKEFSILEYFLTRPGAVVTRSELIEHVWDESFDSMSNVVDVTIHRLRTKIESHNDQRLIRTVKGVGYALGDARA